MDEPSAQAEPTGVDDHPSSGQGTDGRAAAAPAADRRGRQRSPGRRAAGPPAAEHGVLAPPAPELLLRLPVDGGDWSDHIPPVPNGHDVSVSFTSGRVAALHGSALEALGYRLVRTADGDTATELMDMVLREGTAEENPSWWRALAALAERVYPLTLGPAARMCAPLVEQHERRRP